MTRRWFVWGVGTRESWYVGLLQSTPCTPEHAEMVTMLTQLSRHTVDLDDRRAL